MGTAKRNAVIAFRIVAAELALVAIIAQLSRQVSGGNSVANFFSYFTVQSNLLAIGVLGFGAATLPGGQPKSFNAWRGAATLYLVITGIVYALLLSNLPNGPGDLTPWIDTVLHRILPLVMVVDWLVDRPRQRISIKTALLWLVYPLAYLTYSLVRGPIVKWYPYPFLNPQQGYLRVAFTSIAVAVASAVLALLIAAWARPTKTVEE
ncbi:MAG TPA: Pr6Pr family membrane protein [Candidatus Saccharimonadales bacterium]